MTQKHPCDVICDVAQGQNANIRHGNMTVAGSKACLCVSFGLYIDLSLCIQRSMIYIINAEKMNVSFSS